MNVAERYTIKCKYSIGIKRQPTTNDAITRAEKRQLIKVSDAEVEMPFILRLKILIKKIL